MKYASVLLLTFLTIAQIVQATLIGEIVTCEILRYKNHKVIDSCTIVANCQEGTCFPQLYSIAMKHQNAWSWTYLTGVLEEYQCSEIDYKAGSQFFNNKTSIMEICSFVISKSRKGQKIYSGDCPLFGLQTCDGDCMQKYCDIIEKSFNGTQSGPFYYGFAWIFHQ
jgi:hypothetical protein